jgi:hypothetical protein
MLTNERTVDVEELEALWEASPSDPDEAPAATGPAATGRGSRPRALLSAPSRISGGWIALAWLLFILGMMIFEPSPSPEATIPLWGTLVLAGNLLALVAAALIGPASPRLGFGAATLAGALGVAISIGCRTTAHHPGSWWLVELGATAALTGLAAAGLMGRLGRK